MPRYRTLLPLLLSCVACAAGALSAAPALASHGQTTYFEASNTLLNPATRARAFQQLEHLGVKALRVELYWYDVAPDAASATRPPVDLTSPSNYDWALYDPILAEAQSRHWPVLLTVTSPAPRWATANHKAPYITRPDDEDFQDLMTAVARHYGSEVSTYSIWNEPNHPAFLLPQFNANGTPASPRIYRGLYQAGYAGLQAAGIAKPNVLFGETAPTGYDRINVRRLGALHDVAPLLFMREALCLNSHYVKSRSCGALQMAGYAHHAYTIAVAPTYQTPGADNVTIGTLSRLSRALDLAARAHAIPAHLPIYLTEFGVQSLPNLLGVPLSEQAEYDAISEKIAWEDPQVVAFSQYLLTDEPPHSGLSGYRTGLETLGGGRKPLYYAWPIPLVVSRTGSGYSLWGLVRPATGVTKLRVYVEPNGSRRYRALAVVTTNASGYWTLHSTTPGSSWKVSWRSPSGAVYTGPPIGAN